MAQKGFFFFFSFSFFFKAVTVVELLEEAGVGRTQANGCYFNTGEATTGWESGWALVLYKASPGSPSFTAGVRAWLPFPNPTFGHIFVQKEAIF